jgi:[ribosomal protein S18]-alanine N-acetyltransferase
VTDYQIGPARPGEAFRIANMSRALIEDGLTWRWRPAAVARLIRRDDAEVVVARINGMVVGFAVMQFFEDEGHLVLFGVSRLHRRQGLGRRLLEWLETMAEVAMIGTIRLEVRRKNREARAFYRSLGYREVAVICGYYEGVEDAVRMERTLVRVEI